MAGAERDGPRDLDIFGKMKRQAGALILLAGPVAAEPVAPGGPVDTAAGVAVVSDDAEVGAQRLHLGERVLFDDGAVRYVWLIAQVGDLLLVGLSNGGTGCPALYTWVHAEPGAVRVVEPYFGNCSDQAELLEGVVPLTVAMPSWRGSEGYLGYVYDGVQVREVVLGQRASASGPAFGAAPWEGRDPVEIFRGADWRAVLVDLMGEADYARAADVMQVSAPMERHGGWIVGEGWARSNVRGSRVGIALGLEDGRILVVLQDSGGPFEHWGDPGGLWPPLLRDMMER